MKGKEICKKKCLKVYSSSIHEPISKNKLFNGYFLLELTISYDVWKERKFVKKKMSKRL